MEELLEMLEVLLNAVVIGQRAELVAVEDEGRAVVAGKVPPKPAPVPLPAGMLLVDATKTFPAEDAPGADTVADIWAVALSVDCGEVVEAIGKGCDPELVGCLPVVGEATDKGGDERVSVPGVVLGDGEIDGVEEGVLLGRTELLLLLLLLLLPLVDATAVVNETAAFGHINPMALATASSTLILQRFLVQSLILVR